MKAKWKNTKLKNLQGWQGRLLRTNSTSRLVHEALACPAYPWFITTCTDYSCRKIMEAWPLLIAAVDWVSGWRRTRLVVWLKWISLPSTEAYNRSITLSKCSRRIISRFFSSLFSSHHFSETLTKLIVLFQVFKFFAASFYSVTSSITVTVFMVANLALIDIQEMLPWQFCNFTCEIMN